VFVIRAETEQLVIDNYRRKEADAVRLGAEMALHVGASVRAEVVGAGAALGVGLIGGRAAEAVGRNPGAFNPVLIISLLGMAFAEGLAILVYFVVNK
jgi:F-type H+-transporting ATPase subunit c